MKPKKLNLEKVWQVYLLLKPALESREREELLIDEVERIINLSTPKVLLDSINILYDNKIEFSDMIEFSILFIDALQQNDFFEFVEFIRGLDGISR